MQTKTSIDSETLKFYELFSRMGEILSGTSANGPSRDLGLAKKAYESKDVQMSILAHSGVLKAEENHTVEQGKYVKSVIFGGEWFDGGSKEESC